MSNLDLCDPDAVQFLINSGLTRDELEYPQRAMLSAGVEKMWKIKRALEFLEHTTNSADDARRIERGDPEKQIELMKKMADKVADANSKIPLWQILSGMTPEAVPCMHPHERRTALRKLHNLVIILLKYEFSVAKITSHTAAESCATPHEKAVEKHTRAVEKHTPESPAAPALPEKTFLWDPLPELCFFLGISKAALTRFLRELTGMSANELVDTVRAENLKAKMRNVLFPALKKLLSEAPSKGANDKKGVNDKNHTSPSSHTSHEFDAMTIWKRLKSSRRNPSFQRAVYAIELGFPSHQRLYRACLLVYGKTPSQIEWELIEEFLTAAAQSEEQVQSEQQQKSHESHAVEIEIEGEVEIEGAIEEKRTEKSEAA
jgi:methylphosphotriester-DNA--protein-cysteine methyltransferase